MLLVDDVLNRARVARAWLVRERVEREAALMFAGLARGLRGLGVGAAIPGLAEKAAADEEDHAARCRRIVEASEPGVAPLEPGAPARLGPAELGARERVIYEAVALSCVTETLSVALLGSMREVVTDALVGETVRRILRDEIEHARIGWAVLAAEARRGSVAWLAPHVAGMVRGAVAAGDREGEGAELSGYGILTRARVDAVVRGTLDEVILPGLRSFQIVAEV